MLQEIQEREKWKNEKNEKIEKSKNRFSGRHQRCKRRSEGPKRRWTHYRISRRRHEMKATKELRHYSFIIGFGKESTKKSLQRWPLMMKKIAWTFHWKIFLSYFCWIYYYYLLICKGFHRRVVGQFINFISLTAKSQSVKYLLRNIRQVEGLDSTYYYGTSSARNPPHEAVKLNNKLLSIMNADHIISHHMRPPEIIILATWWCKHLSLPIYFYFNSSFPFNFIS